MEGWKAIICIAIWIVWFTGSIIILLIAINMNIGSGQTAMITIGSIMMVIWIIVNCIILAFSDKARRECKIKHDNFLLVDN